MSRSILSLTQFGQFPREVTRVDMNGKNLNTFGKEPLHILDVERTLVNSYRFYYFLCRGTNRV